MNWIKNRYDQFALALVALLLLALGGLLFLRVNHFPDSFADARVNVIPGEKIVDVDLSTVKDAEAEVQTPSVWQVKKETNQYLFVPEVYMIGKGGTPEKPGIGSNYSDTLTGKPIPNLFFTSHAMSVLDKTIPFQDPDGDGFTNEDEWRGARDPLDPNSWHDSTDPVDKDSHPPYVTKLFLKQWIRVRFRLLFQAYDGDPKKPEEMSFQINAIDRGRKTEFLKLGEKVGNSFYKVEKFEFKEQNNASTGEKQDVSELTVVNTETSDHIVLILQRETDSPDSYALFDYQTFPAGAGHWAHKDIQVKKLQNFVLLPEKDKFYKLIDVKEGQAVIQLPDDGGNYIVVPDPRSKH